MTLSKQIEEAAFDRAGGTCECHRPDCGHGFPHGAPVSRQEARFCHHIRAEETREAEAAQCHVLCLACYKNLTKLPA